MRSIRRLDGHRSTPLVLKSLRFSKEEDIDAYNFPQESDLALDCSDSESECGADSTISRESTPLPASISEFDDDEIHNNSQNDASELEDEAFRCKPQQWIDHSESEDVPSCTPPQQSSSDVDGEALSPEPREPSSIYERGDVPSCAPPQQTSSDVDDEAASPEPREPSSIYERGDVPSCTPPQQSSSDVDDEAVSPEPREPSSIYERGDVPSCTPPQQSSSDVDDEALSPEPREPSSIYERGEGFVGGGQQDDEPREANSPESQQLSPLNQYYPEFDDYEMDDESVEADSPEPRPLFPVHRSHSALDEPFPEGDSQVEMFCPGPMRRFLTPKSMAKLDFFEDWFAHMNERPSINESPENPISKTSSPNDQFRLTSYDCRQSTSQMEIFCPKPIRQHPTHKVILQPELFEDWHVDMSEPVFVDEVFSPERQSTVGSETPRPEQQKFPPQVRHNTPYLELNSCERRQSASQIEIFCPKPIRQHPTHKAILQPELFEDWHVDMSEPVFVDEAFSPERQSTVVSETPSPEQQKFFPPVRHDTPYLESDHDEEDVESALEADSPEPRRPFSAPQFHSTLMYDTKSVLGYDDDEEAFETLEYTTREFEPIGF